MPRANPQLYEEERPRSWKALLGWPELKRYLASKRRDPRWSSDSLALVGPSGVGKTTVARLLAAEFAKGARAQLDVHWLDAGKLGGIDEVRGLEEKLRYVPLAKKRLVVVDEAHNLSHAARRGLLGLLERLPKRTLVVFTASSDKWLDLDGGALRRRLKVFEVGEVPASTIERRIRRVARRRGWKLAAKHLRAIAAGARGNLGQALQDLEIVAATGRLPLSLRRRAKGKRCVSRKKGKPAKRKAAKRSKASRTAAKKKVRVRGPKGSRVVSLGFPRKWKVKRCRSWAKTNGFELFKSSKVRGSVRDFRVKGYSRWSIVGSKKLDSGVILRFGLKGKPKRKPKGKKKKPRKNPPRPANLSRAVALRKRFHAAGVEVRVRTRKLPRMDSLYFIGPCPLIQYDSDKYDGEEARYEHDFEESGLMPDLYMHPSGKFAVLIPPGGKRFEVDERGIL